MKERLQKYIAKHGVASRRKAEELIFSGRVKVNGIIVNSIVTIDDEADKVEVDGKPLDESREKIYIMMNKPLGVITSAKDQFGRKTVIDLIDLNERIYPVGRLDYDTSGLLILTNDGDVTFRMTHPSHEVDKTYIAEIKGIPNSDELAAFRNGLNIEDYITSNAKIDIIKTVKDNAIVEIVIHEGKNRQIRKMCEKIGHPVINLKRIKFGFIELKNLKPGEWRYLSKKEIEYIRSI